MEAKKPNWDEIDEVLTVAGLAKIIKVSASAIRGRLTKNKNLPPHIPKSPGTQTRWNKEDVKKWYESLEA